MRFHYQFILSVWNSIGIYSISAEVLNSLFYQWVLLALMLLPILIVILKYLTSSRSDDFRNMLIDTLASPCACLLVYFSLVNASSNILKLTLGTFVLSSLFAFVRYILADLLDTKQLGE